MTPGPVVMPLHARGGVLRFVLESWRGIARHDLVMWLRLAAAVGLAQGVALTLYGWRLVWWHQFISAFVDGFVPIVLLFLCLAVARNVHPRRMPKWVPFACAALAAVLLFELGSLATCACDEPQQAPGPFNSWVSGLWINVPPIVLMCFLASFGYMHALDARRRADALRGVQLDGARLGRQSYESRLQAMQARVEPQFLFDTLEDVEQLYETDPTLAEQVLDDLIVYLRGVLPSLEDSNSTVSIELEIARAWLDIMKVRARGRLAWSLDKGTGVGAAHMPPMVLLPLVEHVVKPATTFPAPVQVLSIAATRDGERVRVVITDSRGSFAASAATDQIADVRARLHARYGASAALSFVVAPHGATQAVVDLPYERDT